VRSLLYTLREIDTLNGRVSFLRVWVRWVCCSLAQRLTALRIVEKHLVFFRWLSRSQFGAGLLQIAFGLMFVGLMQVVVWFRTL
jgi:hypothetical protein